MEKIFLHLNQIVSMQRPPQGRLGFIDFTRGVIMALMAWDHVAGFWYS